MAAERAKNDPPSDGDLETERTIRHLKETVSSLRDELDRSRFEGQAAVQKAVAVARLVWEFPSRGRTSCNNSGDRCLLPLGPIPLCFKASRSGEASTATINLKSKDDLAIDRFESAFKFQ